MIIDLPIKAAVDSLGGKDYVIVDVAAAARPNSDVAAAVRPNSDMLTSIGEDENASLVNKCLPTVDSDRKGYEMRSRD